MYYAGTTRTIREGDRVIGIGECDHRSVDCLQGRVELLGRGAGRGYVAHVRFETGYGSTFNWWVYADNIRPADGEGAWESDGKRRCTRCGVELSDSVLGKYLYKGVDICDKCIAHDIGEVHGYHFAKKLRYNVEREKITLGAEIEIDAPSRGYVDNNGFADECVGYARANNYPLIMSYESDGSLRDGGVECVTAPLTVDEWRGDAVKKQLDFLFDTADEMGFSFDARNHAGLHVHIGRKDLCGSDRSVSDAVGLLMGWACTRLWDNGLRKLAGRDANNYCRRYDRDSCNDEIGGAGLTDTPAQYDRYYFVNITNDKTIELRIFNRATCYADVLVAIDVCYMLGKWATKKINAYLKRGSYSAKAKDFTDALAYADRVTWDALVKFSKYPEITLPRMRDAGIKI